MDITVMVGFNRFGDIPGHPRIPAKPLVPTRMTGWLTTFAVMETLKRWAPVPFTHSTGGVVAEHPFAVHFHHRRPPLPSI